MSRIRANQITNQSADGAPTVQNGLVISGVTTSTTFSGSGASLTNLNASNIASGTVPTARLGSGTANSSTFLAGDSTFKTVTGTTINNNGSNRIITGSSTANTLEGEATFTYDGVSKAKIDTSQTYGYLQLDGNSGGSIEFFANGTRKFEIYGIDAGIEIFDREKGSYHSKFLSGGNVEISDGKLLIGTATEGNSNADDLTVANSGEGGITIRSGSSSNGNIFFSDATSGAGEYAGFIDYKHSSNVMTFGTNGSERLRINNDGSYYFLGDSSNNTRLRLLSDGAITGGSGANDVSLEFASGQGNNMASEGAQLRYDNSNGKLHISTTYNSSDADIRFYTRTGALDSESNLRMNIMGDGYIMTPSQPSFRATKSGSSFNTGGGIVVFDQNQHNTGSNYNTSNGRFTAPVTGTYIFTYYSIYTGNANNDLWDFRKNGSTFAGSRMHFTSGSVGGSWDNITNTQILTLSANDYVEVYASDQGLHGGDWCHFCGHLLG